MRRSCASDTAHSVCVAQLVLIAMKLESVVSWSWGLVLAPITCLLGISFLGLWFLLARED